MICLRTKGLHRCFRKHKMVALIHLPRHLDLYLWLSAPSICDEQSNFPP